MPFSAERIRQEKAAWLRLKRDRRSWDDWILVGYALLEGRAITMGDRNQIERHAVIYTSP